MEDFSLTADAIVSCNPQIKSIDDLAGAKVAFEEFSVSDVLFRYALEQAGISFDDIEYVPIPAADAGTAAVAGRVDVAVTYEPYLQAALEEGDNCKIIYTAKERPGLISDALGFSTEFTESNPDAVIGVMQAWDDAVDFYNSDTEEAQAIIAKAVGEKPDALGPSFKGIALRSRGVAGLPRERLRDALGRHRPDHARPGPDQGGTGRQRLPEHRPGPAGPRQRQRVVHDGRGRIDRNAGSRGPEAAPADRPGKQRRRRLAGIFDPIEPRTYMIIAILAFVVLFIGWWIAAEINLAKDIFLPSPVDVWNRAVELAKDGTLWADTKVSFVRITIGFAISTAIALPIGIPIGTYRSRRRRSSRRSTSSATCRRSRSCP
ncbi:MAG: ABC transporter substrate-binding protein [Solirubrobacterales bacterium]